MSLASNHIDSAELPRLHILASRLQRLHGRMRYVSYQQAEEDCEQLASLLLRHYSRQDLREFGFAAIPRGGHIVLGMLAYVLDLHHDQLLPKFQNLQPLCIVDDCALTGVRFGQTLERADADHVVFAHLYSNPALRQAIMASERRVTHCLSAHDLVDHAVADRDAEAYQAWITTWQKRSPKRHYWLGQPDLVCFAWSEPDWPFWNPVTEHVEDGWRFTPPHLCLKNRTLLALPSRPVERREWQTTSATVFGSFDGVIWLCQTETEQVYSLEGVAADMWRALAGYGNTDSALGYLLGEYDVAVSSLRADLEAFAEQLRMVGLLARIDAA